MSTLKVDAIRHNSATSDAITTHSDGTVSAKIIDVGGGQLSHRNKVINGAMNICQRATTQNTISSSGYYVADRFNINMVNVGSFRTNLFQSSQSPDGFNNSLGVSIGTGTAGAIASSERVSLEQRIEAQDLQNLSFGTSAAKSFTLSFYVRSSRTGQYGINMRQHDSGKDYNEKFNISSANTWERKTITVSGNTGDTFADDNGIGLWFRIMLRAGSSSVGNVNYQSWGSSDADKAPTGQQTTWGTDANDDFYLTGVQLEVGDTATSFEHLSLAEDKRRCYRYCQRGRHASYCLVGTPGTYYFSRGNINLYTPMRATVTGTLKAATWNSNRYFVYRTWSSETNVTAAPASTTFASGSITGVPDILSVQLHISISSGSSNSALPANGPGSNNVYPIEYFDVLLEAEL